MFRDFGTAEIVLLLAVFILLFGAKKLPETARGLGRALRIFKAETKGLREDEDAADTPTPHPAPQPDPPRQIVASVEAATKPPVVPETRPVDEPRRVDS